MLARSDVRTDPEPLYGVKRLKHCKGTYTLIIKLSTDGLVAVGKLGNYTLKEGFYAYTGSALGLKGSNLANRLSRHVKKLKRLKWHVDYFLANPYVKIVSIVYALNDVKTECLVARALAALPYARTPVKRFGSSDCRCDAHLHYFEGKGLRKVEEAVLNAYKELGLKPVLLSGSDLLELLRAKRLKHLKDDG